jgi:glycosidase
MKRRRLLPAALLAGAALAQPAAAGPRPVIYQLMVRHFANHVETREPNGTLARNGCGTFAGINDTALAALKDLGVTHLWLTGVPEQASGTAHPGRPADDPDILKGIAGSPYAIKDCFDVSPDYAADPAARLDEFRDLVKRCHESRLKVLIDFVPNHVSRAYRSDVRPDLSFGDADERGVFFARDNHFFHLGAEHPGGGPPLRLPTAGKPGCDGLFEGERAFGRVTGNNAATWTPGEGDWFETVKLNYGHDFTARRDSSHLPGPDAPPAAVPRTWRTMDEVLAWWQGLGVDGFRVDMAHLVPLEFWRWAVARARARAPGVFFVAEAYDNDPAKLTGGNVLEALLDAGFDAVYDDAAYDLLEQVATGPKWANDLDAHVHADGAFFEKALRYGENHDEVRLASPRHWGGHGMSVARPVCGILFALGCGPVMIYNGQEVGESGVGAEGFGGDDGRTTIFDYWSLPALQQWTNGGKFDGARLEPARRELREFHRRLLAAVQRPALSAGRHYGLNHANTGNPDFGRLPGESASGHWLYAFLRRDRGARDAVLVVANLHGRETFAGVRLAVPAHALEWLGLGGATLRGSDLLGSGARVEAPLAGLAASGLPLPPLPPHSVFYFHLDWPE